MECAWRDSPKLMPDTGEPHKFVLAYAQNQRNGHMRGKCGGCICRYITNNGFASISTNDQYSAALGSSGTISARIKLPLAIHRVRYADGRRASTIPITEYVRSTCQRIEDQTSATRTVSTRTRTRTTRIRTATLASPARSVTCVAGACQSKQACA